MFEFVKGVPGSSIQVYLLVYSAMPDFRRVVV